MLPRNKDRSSSSSAFLRPATISNLSLSKERCSSSSFSRAGNWTLCECLVCEPNGALHLFIKEMGNALDELLENGKPTPLSLNFLNRLPQFFLLLLNPDKLFDRRSHGRDVGQMRSREVGEALAQPCNSWLQRRYRRRSRNYTTVRRHDAYPAGFHALGEGLYTCGVDIWVSGVLPRWPALRICSCSHSFSSSSSSSLNQRVSEFRTAGGYPYVSAIKLSISSLLFLASAFRPFLPNAIRSRALVYSANSGRI